MQKSTGLMHHITVVPAANRDCAQLGACVGLGLWLWKSQPVVSATKWACQNRQERDKRRELGTVTEGSSFKKKEKRETETDPAPLLGLCYTVTLPMPTVASGAKGPRNPIRGALSDGDAEPTHPFSLSGFTKAPQCLVGKVRTPFRMAYFLPLCSALPRQTAAVTELHTHTLLHTGSKVIPHVSCFPFHTDVCLRRA